MEELDVRVLRSIPTPIADSLLARGCRKAGNILAQPDLLKEALTSLHVQNPEAKAEALLNACKKEITVQGAVKGGAAIVSPLGVDSATAPGNAVLSSFRSSTGDGTATSAAGNIAGFGGGAWGSADSALELLQKAQAKQPLSLPCEGVSKLLGNSLRPGGGGFLEICGLPGTGKTQLCLQLCASAQIGVRGSRVTGDAVYIDAEGSFVPRRYSQVCRAALAEQRDDDPGLPSALEEVLRRMHVCRTYDAAELYAAVKNLESFLAKNGRVRIIVLDSIAFCFRHEHMDNLPLRSRILTDIATTLRRYSVEHNLIVVITNHMTTCSL